MMWRKYLPAVALALFSVPGLFAQADGCRGALDALNRVKEEITPDLGKNPTDTYARDQLKTMFTTMEAASHACDDYPELYYYRSIIAERLGDKREAAYSEGKYREAHYQPSYNPFTISAAELAAATAPPGPVRKKWALVVGINQFKDKQLPPLNFATKDSKDFAKYLLDPRGGKFEPASVTTLTDSQATYQAFWEAFAELRAEAQPDDLVVIYLASHGSPRKDDPNGVSFVMMHDSDLDSPNKMFATAVEMIDLGEKLNREIRARRVVLILDTCYSGDASAAGQQEAGSRGMHPVWAIKPPDTAPAGLAYSGALQKLKTGEGRAVITASRADEQSWEAKSFQNGYFTHFLIDALRQSGGTKTLADLFPVVRDQVSLSVSRDYPGQKQTPSFDFNGQAAAIIIGIPEKAE